MLFVQELGPDHGESETRRLYYMVVPMLCVVRVIHVCLLSLVENDGLQLFSNLCESCKQTSISVLVVYRKVLHSCVLC